MADLKISALNSLAGADLVAADVVAVVDDSASETKKLTVSDLIANGVTLISNSTIPSAKILFSAGAIDTAELAASSVETAKINDSAVTAAKLADNSSVTLVSTLPASGDFTGQIALDTDDDKIYIWDGSAWDSVKGAGSINVVNGSTTGEVNIVASTSGDTVTISATLDNTTAAAQFLAGPTGAAGAVGYRAIIGTDLPAATTTTKGAVIVNGEGLRMDSDTIEIDNDLTANTSSFQAVKFDSKGLITSGRDITSADLPNATSGATGAVKPGTGLEMGTGGAIDHSNSVTGATKTKITFDAQGHVTAGTDLAASDVPALDTAKITTGTFATARIADDAITAAKLGDKSTTTISETTPAGGSFIGQAHLNSITGDFLVWDGNVWQPIGISVGQIVLAGTYDASTNLMATVTSEGTSLSFVVGNALPAASASNKGYYVVVSEAGTGTSPAPTVSLNPPDFLLSTGTAYTEIDVSSTFVAQTATNVAFTAAGNIAATNVQSALEELDTEKVGSASPTFTGTVGIGTAATIQFEGATANDFETTLTVTDPTADRTITLPDVTGTVVTTGDTGSVTSTMIVDGTIANADISSSAEIAVSKLANGTARQLLQTDAAGTGVEFTSNVDIPGTFDCTGAGTFDSTLTVTGLISADGKVSFPAGTASAPSFYFGTDTNTGLYHSAADEVAITTGGTQRVVVDSSGHAGIGVSSPTSVLDIRDTQTGAASEIKLFNLDQGNTATQTSALVMTPDVRANGAKISVIKENADFSSSANKDVAITFAPVSNNTATERLRIDSSGKVGVGTSSPAQRLHVASGASTYVQVQNTGDSVNAYYGVDTGGAWVGASTNHPLKLHTNNIERLRIDSSGRLLIGTTTEGNSFADNLTIADSGSCGLTIRAGSSSYGSIHFSDATSGTGEYAGYIEYRHSDNALAFGTSSTERLRITSSGVVTVRRSSVGEIDALTSASTITPDFAASNNFSVTLGTNATLANPSNLTAGQSGVIAITQDGTGSRTLAYGSKFKFAGGTAPTLTTTASAVDILTYYVESTSRITAQVLLNVS